MREAGNDGAWMHAAMRLSSGIEPRLVARNDDHLSLILEHLEEIVITHRVGKDHKRRCLDVFCKVKCGIKYGLCCFPGGFGGFVFSRGAALHGRQFCKINSCRVGKNLFSNPVALKKRSDFRQNLEVFCIVGVLICYYQHHDMGKRPSRRIVFDAGTYSSQPQWQNCL